MADQQKDQQQDPADALNPNSGANLTEEQRKHREEVYGYARDEEGTLDTSAQLEQETLGVPTDSKTTGPDADIANRPDNLLIPGFNNPIDDNNR